MSGLGAVLVWDPLVRWFHWLLVASVAVAILTGGDGMRWHVVSGCMVIGLGLFRLAWGFIGSGYALWREFVRRPVEVVAYLRQVVAGHADRYLGHNPAGGMMVVVLLATVVGCALTGLILYGVGEFSGPFAAWAASMTPEMAGWWRQGHRLLAWGLPGLIALHLAGVVFTGWRHRENLVESMFTGRKHP
ncbi:MAG: cytochrome b/b6 domain-containing protein [Magnetococcales bacterium]|nr:cytochrome b/b6 domain-containing protein [Magnetococcales bacterium]